VREIRKIEKESRLSLPIPMIAVTGFSSIEDKDKCIREGFDYVIVKPATKQSL